MSLDLVRPVFSSASSGVSEDEVALVRQMLDQLDKYRVGNRRRQEIYDQKNLFRDLRISTPPQLRNLEAVLGWGAKAVDVLADRISFERFVLPGGDENPYGLNDIVLENDFDVEFGQATTSALTHSCAFIVVGQGLDGEPDMLWLTRSAMHATGVWDRRKRGLAAGLTVSTDDAGNLERVIAYFPDRVLDISVSGGRLSVTPAANPTGRVLMEPVRFSPDLRRPFGRSRITPTVEYLVEGAVRTVVRSEVGAEFFAAPQRYGLGLDEDAFDMDKWSAVTGRFLAISRDEDGELPQLGQFSQHSMQPHVDHLRMWAYQLAGETSIPVNELGFVSDNPTSDEAIQSQRDPLRLIADKAIRVFRAALRNLAVSTVMLRDGLDAVPDGLGRVSAWFTPTFRVSDAAATDAALKQVQMMPWMAESEVLLERLNFSADEIERLQADRKRSEGRSMVQMLVGLGDAKSVPGQPATIETVEEQ